MKVISLNIWGGRAGGKALLKFFEDNKHIDIFCLQEVWSAPYEHLEGKVAGGVEISHSNVMTYGLQEISKVLDSHTRFFHPHHLDNYGLMMMIKNDISVIKDGDVFVYKERGHVPTEDAGFHARNVQYVTFESKNDLRTILNFHGLWNGKGKDDNEDRLKQSDNIIAFLKSLSHPYVFVGDFNLLPKTESLKKFEEFGLRNLIKEYGVTSTRTSIYKKENKFADYVFVSEGITVKNFRVLSNEVSDHAPLYLEFE